MVFSQVVQQVQPVIGQFHWNGFLVLFHLFMDLVVKKSDIDRIKEKKKAPGIPPSAATKSM